MNICFVANYSKTYLFHEISKQLQEQHGVSVFWIVVNKKLNQFLLTHYEQNQILYLPIDQVLNNGSETVGEFKLNELIYGDRVLKYNQELGHRYLTGIQKPIFDFIYLNKIKYIFGEVTWAHELLILRMVSGRPELNCQYLNPHTVRIPKGRIAFFKDEFQSKIVVTDDEYLNKEYPANAFIPTKPDYLKRNDAKLKKQKSLKGRLKRLKNYITGENLDKNDITLFKPHDAMRTVRPIKEELNKEIYRLISRVNLNFLLDKKFILIALHKQPEASIDVIGRYVENQEVNILNVWRQLPNDWYLVVKEHSNAVGDRPYAFYRKLVKYKNIVFVNEKADSYQLLELSQAVVTVSGTIGYEAALMRKKALVFGDVFFDLSYVKKISFQDFKNSHDMVELLNSIPDNNKNDDDIKKLIFFNSYEAIISDPISNPLCIAKENVAKLTNLFSKVIFTSREKVK